MRIFATGLLLGTTAITPLAAEPVEGTVGLGEIVTSLRRTETPIEDTTVSVSVVDGQRIEEKDAVNTQVGEILSKSVAGFSQPNDSVSDYGLQLRGRSFQTLIDGVPQSNLSYSTGRSLNVINPAAVGQVEVVRGATAAYGFGAPGGLVNIVTRAPAEDGLHSSVTTGISVQPGEAEESFGYSTSATITRREGNKDFVLNGAFESTGASFTPEGDRRPPDVVGRQGALDDATNANILAKGGVELDEGRVEVMANYFEYSQDSDWAGTRTGGDGSENVSATPHRGDPSDQQPGAGNLVLSARYTAYDVFGGEMTLQGYYTWNDTTFAAVDFFGVTYPELVNESEKYGTRLTFDTPLTASTGLVWGLDLIREHTSITDLSGDYVPDYEVHGYAPFAQATAELGSATITGGIRFESLDVEIPSYVPGAGLPEVDGGTLEFDEALYNISGSYEFVPMAVLFGGYSEGFELSNLGRYLTDSSFTDVDQLSEKGQTTRNLEIGLRGDDGRLSYSAAAFHSENDNGSTYDEDLNLVLAREEINGVELSADYRVNGRWTVGGTVTAMEGRYDSDGDGRLDTDLGSDRIQPAKTTAYVAFSPNGWSDYRIEVLHSGTRDPDSDEYLGLESIDGFTVVDASAGFDLGGGRLSLDVENLLDTDYVPVLAQAYSARAYGYDDYYFVKGAGRTLSARYTFEF